MRKLLYASIAILFVVACTARKEQVKIENASSEAVISSTPPFQTKEPERYRATRTITITTAAGEVEVTRTSIARDGELRRYESDAADNGDEKIVYLDIPEGRFVLLPAERIYADLALGSDVGLSQEDETVPEALLHADSARTTYQKIGLESIGGRHATKYRVVVNNSSSGNVSVSETLIWIDDALHMPIRSETASAGGSKIKMELSDVTLDVDKSIFQVPSDYKKVKSIGHKEAQK